MSRMRNETLGAGTLAFAPTHWGPMTFTGDDGLVTKIDWYSSEWVGKNLHITTRNGSVLVFVPEPAETQGSLA